MKLIIFLFVAASARYQDKVNSRCSGVLEDWESWGNGAQWNIRLDSRKADDDMVVLEFDKPLESFQVFNGKFETEDMMKYEITREKYQYEDTETVQNFLVKYASNSQPANMKSIQLGGRNMRCMHEQNHLPKARSSSQK